MFFKQIPTYIKQKLNIQHQGFEKKKKTNRFVYSCNKCID